ncbi:DUF664 domain-containing protein [Streptomyces scopuliridis]|uniref:mycothiol transferase n=1 Tax=Streptomyces scopuliridis TaxID=452529 RepID=UPI0036ABDE4A
MPPSTLSLLGLVRHMAEVGAWFRRVFEDNNAHMVWSDIDFQAAYDASASTRPRWRTRAASSERPNPLTWSSASRKVMVHVLLEYGRHNRHADFLREVVDGTVGT